MFRLRISSDRPAVSKSIRYNVFSRRRTSRRAMNRSTAMRERAGVSESGTVSRFAPAGTAGASRTRGTSPLTTRPTHVGRRRCLPAADLMFGSHPGGSSWR